MSEAIPTDLEGIFDWVIRLSRRVAEVAAIKKERQKQRRCQCIPVVPAAWADYAVVLTRYDDGRGCPYWERRL